MKPFVYTFYIRTCYFLLINDFSVIVKRLYKSVSEVEFKIQRVIFKIILRTFKSEKVVLKLQIFSREKFPHIVTILRGDSF